MFFLEPPNQPPRAPVHVQDDSQEPKDRCQSLASLIQVRHLSAVPCQLSGALWLMG